MHVDGFYMFETEISNREYSEFLLDVKKNNPEVYEKAKIDPSGWDHALSYENPYAKEYHTAGFEDYPVVNISHEGAALFCQWLSDKFSRHGRKIDIMLPDAVQWTYAAKGGNPQAEYPWEGSDVKTKKDIYFCNYNSPDDGQCTPTAFVKAYQPNTYGLYNMCGNVAEMLKTAGTTKGGSWNSDALHMKISAGDEYSGTTGPSPYIGFRPVAMIRK